jgi:hypothetical protein
VSDKIERYLAAVEAVEECLKEGFTPKWVPGPGNRTALHVASERFLNLNGEPYTPRGFQLLLERARQKGIVPDWSLFRDKRYQQPVAKLQLLPVKTPTPPKSFGVPRRVLVIPDRHNDPRHEHRLDVTLWLARLGSDIRANDVVDLGDSITMDSCSRYDKNDTLKGRGKPPIKADLDNHTAMLQIFESGRAKDWKPKMIRMRGNHEQRLFDFENQHPENEGTHTHRYAQDLLQFGWRERGYGEITFIEGVGFTHAPFNGIGKAMGGKTATHRAGSLLCQSLVHGHTHSYEVHNSAKLGPTDKVTVIQSGCALPDGEVEHYATHNPTGWSYGALDITVLDSQIIDINWISMRTIRDRYSDDGG